MDGAKDCSLASLEEGWCVMVSCVCAVNLTLSNVANECYCLWSGQDVIASFIGAVGDIFVFNTFFGGFHGNLIWSFVDYFLCQLLN